MSIDLFKEEIELKPVDLQGNGLMGNGLIGNGIMGNGIDSPSGESNFDLFLKELKF